MGLATSEEVRFSKNYTTGQNKGEGEEQEVDRRGCGNTILKSCQGWIFSRTTRATKIRTRWKGLLQKLFVVTK